MSLAKLSKLVENYLMNDSICSILS